MVLTLFCSEAGWGELCVGQIGSSWRAGWLYSSAKAVAPWTCVHAAFDGMAKWSLLAEILCSASIEGHLFITSMLYPSHHTLPTKLGIHHWFLPVTITTLYLLTGDFLFLLFLLHLLIVIL